MFEKWGMQNDPNWRAEFRAARLEATLINVNRQRGQRRARAEDLMPTFTREPGETSGERLYRQMTFAPAESTNQTPAKTGKGRRNLSAEARRST